MTQTEVVIKKYQVIQVSAKLRRVVDEVHSTLIEQLSWPDKNDKVTDASPNSESRSPSPGTNYSGWGSPPGTGSGS